MEDIKLTKVRGELKELSSQLTSAIYSIKSSVTGFHTVDDSVEVRTIEGDVDDVIKIAEAIIEIAKRIKKIKEKKE